MSEVFRKDLETGGTAEIHVTEELGQLWLTGYRNGHKLNTSTLGLKANPPRPWLTHTA